MIKTSPSYPDKAAKGDVITMFVSTGKEQVPDVTVRNMKGVDVSTAVDQLTDLGLTVDPEYTYVNSNSYTSRGIVVDQTPAGETSVSPGTQVKLTLSSGYRDVTIPLALPMEATTGVDVQVYVDGTLDQELSKTGLLPSDIKTLNLEIKNVQKAEYSVTIQISPTGANRYTRFASFRVNGSTGSITTEYLNPYEDPLCDHHDKFYNECQVLVAERRGLIIRGGGTNMSETITGLILQGISGFYSVEAADTILECRARGLFRKEDYASGGRSGKGRSGGKQRHDNGDSPAEKRIDPAAGSQSGCAGTGGVLGGTRAHLPIMDRMIAVAEYKEIEPVFGAE